MHVTFEPLVTTEVMKIWPAI